MYRYDPDADIWHLCYRSERSARLRTSVNVSIENSTRVLKFHS